VQPTPDISCSRLLKTTFILLIDFLADLASAIRSVYGMMASVHPLLPWLVIGIVVVHVILRFI
jgi:hypothetical protein